MAGAENIGREILFRGKRVNCGGEWVYGSLIQSSDGSSIWSEKLKDDVEVHPATVGQYTGLTDKNGVKIFEGDIVKLNSTLYLVDWISHVGMFALRYLSNRKSITDFSIIDPERCEVFGNIHDNPKILGVTT